LFTSFKELEVKDYLSCPPEFEVSSCIAINWYSHSKFSGWKDYGVYLIFHEESRDQFLREYGQTSDRMDNLKVERLQTI
jgi:hypothetical protein